jgi:hypothetical protein
MPKQSKVTAKIIKHDTDASSDDEIVKKSINKTPEKISKPEPEPSEKEDTSDSDNNISNSESEVEEVVVKKNKEKKEKKSVIELLEPVDNIKKKLKEKKLSISILEKEIIDLEKQLFNILSQIEISHTSEIKNIQKESKISKRKGNPNGGFNKPVPVPEPLRKLFKLEKDAELPRTQVVSLFHTELKNRELKKGQNAILDKKIVKELGIDKSYENSEISFGEFQTFIAKFYNEENEKKTVTI